MGKKVLGVDCDEVLCYLMQDYILFWNEKTGEDLKYEDITTYDFVKFFHFNEPKVRPYSLFVHSVVF